MALVKDPHHIKLAVVGMVESNGHPYSWSAIFNGFDPDVMAKCPYPVIPQYLNAQPPKEIGIEGVQVTHIWCDIPADAEQVAQAAKITHVVERPEDVIGEVDAVIIPTDKGWEHFERARPFIDADLPVFIDKPLTDRADHLREFVRWYREGRAFLSSSCMRYCKEYAALDERLGEVGKLCLITMTTAKSWERYGIHALEGVYPFLPAGGWESVTNTGTETANIVHLRHTCGTNVVLASIADMLGGFGYLNLHGTKGSVSAKFEDTFYAFKAQLMDFVDYLRTGNRPFPFEETIEQMQIIISGIRSREQHGKRVVLSEIDIEVLK